MIITKNQLFPHLPKSVDGEGEKVMIGAAGTDFSRVFVCV